MDLRDTLDEREKLVRTVLAAGLALVAIRSLRNGKRFSGLLAGGGALAVAYVATAESGELEELTETVETEVTETIGEVTTDEGTPDERTTDEGSKLRCAACGEPIAPGQSRGPNDDDEIVHRACK